MVLNLSQLQKNAREKFDKLVKVPEILAEMKGQTCIICGQPFDKSEQVNELRQLLDQAIANACEEMGKSVMVEEMKKLMIENGWDEGHEEGFNNCRSDIQSRIKEFLEG
jgi:flagellar biosynthesis/type III secretory pathway protein FliH